MAPRDVGASRSSQCDWRDSRSTPFSVRAHRDPLYSLTFSTPQHPLSRVTRPAPPPPNPLHVRVRLFLPFVPSVTPPASISRPFFLVALLASIYLTPRAMYILAPPFSLEISPRLSLSLSPFLSHSSFLLGRSIYPYFFLSVAPPVLPTRLVARVSFCPSATLQTPAKLVT